MGGQSLISHISAKSSVNQNYSRYKIWVDNYEENPEEEDFINWIGEEFKKDTQNKKKIRELYDEAKKGLITNKDCKIKAKCTAKIESPKNQKVESPKKIEPPKKQSQKSKSPTTRNRRKPVTEVPDEKITKKGSKSTSPTAK